MATVACVAWRFEQFVKQLGLRRFLSALKLLKNHQATQAMARGTGKIQIRLCDWLPEKANAVILPARDLPVVFRKKGVFFSIPHS